MNRAFDIEPGIDRDRIWSLDGLWSTSRARAFFGFIDVAHAGSKSAKASLMT
jgi:hypothetical protein